MWRGVVVSCNISPLAAGVETGVIPDGGGLIAGELAQHDLESFHPFAILIIVVNEDLGAIWGSHEVPPFLTAEKQLIYWGVPFRDQIVIQTPHNLAPNGCP